jgi:sensor histidine kinase YesM
VISGILLFILAFVLVYYIRKHIRSHSKEIAPENLIENSKLKWRKGMERAASDAMNAEVPYWTAILTFDGIIIAILAASSTDEEVFRWIRFTLVALSFASAVLVILNFYVRLIWLRNIALIFRVQQNKLAEESAKQEQYAAEMFDKILQRESWILPLLIVQGIAILALFLPKL